LVVKDALLLCVLAGLAKAELADAAGRAVVFPTGSWC
jgi:hypothetical protein